MTRSPTNTREKLIETAKDLIWQNSYGHVSVDDICKAAQVHKGSFYHYFPSKIDLTLAVLDSYYTYSKPFFDEIFNADMPPKERFGRLAKFGYEKQKEAKEKYGRVCGCPFMALGSEMGGYEQAISDKINTVVKENQKYYSGAIEDMIALGELPKDTDVKAKASQIHAYVVGHIMLARVQNSLEPLRDNLVEGIFDILGVSEKQKHKEYA
ncbi:MAG TPA: TetR/AcrR family transcriptional regulator [Alphaproteobacteria bacterium]|nr:TetR/AcrR family transcriptional regulator [Alphaproteobacteria bacterium]